MKTKTTLTRRVLALCMSVLMLMTAWVFVAPTKANAAGDVWDGTWDGSGFSNNHITSAKGFAQFINNAGTGTSYSGQTVYLDVDIDLNSIDFGNISGGKNVYYSRDNFFQGTFDGQGHTIYHFQMHNNDHRVGLFRSAKNATFKNVTVDGVYVDDNDNGNKKNGFAVMVGYGEGNLTFENVHIKNGIVYGYNYVGGLVGEYGANDTLRITNCSSNLTVHADNNYAGGLIGYSKGSVIASDCSNTGEIYAGYKDAAGIAGWIEDDESSFTNCSNAGKVSTDACAGGIVGYMGSKNQDKKLTLNGCSNTGEIESRGNGYVAGGLAGKVDTDAEHSFENNVNRGSVHAKEDAGGIVGSNIGKGIWRNNKNYGSVLCDNDNAGGILGEVEDDQNKFYNCYNTGAVQGKNSVGGILGFGNAAAHEFYNCGNSGTITSTNDSAAGIYGYGGDTEPTIEQCWNIGTIKAYNDAGGILGHTNHHSYIRRCWNAGSIETYNHNDNGAHGGIAGQTSDLSGSSNDNPNMTDCFNWGPVSGGRDDGGLIGKIKDGRTPYYITNSYNAGTVTGVRPFAIIAYGGNVGNNVYYNNNVAMGDAQGTGISENDLNNSAGFSGNYCKNTWGVSIGGRTYRFPILNWYRNLFMFHLKFQDAPSGTNVYWDGEYNSAFYAPNPTRRGYTTDHWFLTTDANKTIAIPTEIITCGVTPCTDSLLMTQSFSEVTDVSNDSTFNLTWQKIKQKLDMNAVLNGEYKFDNINFFTADVYVNGTKVADDVNDFYQDLEFEDTYEITDIKTADGYRFVGAYNGTHDGRQQSGLTGQMDIDLIEVAPEFKTLHTVTVTPGTGTTISGVESGTYAWGDKVTVTATAETGYDQSAPVLKVNGNVTASGSEITITGDTTITTDALQLNTYTVNFYNGNPDTPYATRTYTHGDALVSPEDPTFSDGTDTDYRFVGWAAAAYPDEGWNTEVTLPEIVTANANYYSLYDGYVTVTWKNGNETLAGPASAMVGTVPVYDGETPTTADAQYTYTAIGWNTDPNATAALDPLPELGTSNVTYYAVYDKNDPDHRTVNKYTITWKNWDGTVLDTDEVEYGATPVYSGPTPTRANDAQYTYGAYHWDPMIAAVSGPATYTAQFDYTVNAYTVTWKNWDGTVLETDEDVSYGAEPTFDGETPTRDADSENHYVFAGWDDDSTVKGDKIITATFTPAAHVFDQQNTDAKYLQSGATCTDKALYYYSCSCGYKGTETFEYGDKLEHSFTNYVSNNDATCTKDGTKTAKCDLCGVAEDTINDEGSKLDHVFTNYVSNNDATCTKDGTETAKCDLCGVAEDTINDEGSKLDHVFTNYVSNNDATCTKDGTKTAKCDLCGVAEDTINDEGSKLDHVFTNYVSNNDATCTKDGTKTAKCDLCGVAEDTIDDEGSKLDHTPGEAIRENEVPASCTAEGSYDEVVYCSVCNEELSRETKTIEKKAHTPGEPVRENEKAASCSAEGSYDEVVYCSVCHEELSRETKTIDKLAHTPGEPVREKEVPASCAAEGSYDEVVYCSVCGEELSREAKTIEKIAHTPGEAVRENEVPATCRAEGSYDEVVYCSVCGEELSREAKTIEKIAHTSGEPVRENEVPATCSAAGSYNEVVYCSVCGEELSREAKTIEKIAHTPAEAVRENEAPATCSASGSYNEVVYCTVCGEELSRETKTIDKLAHTPGEAVRENEVPATCAAEGSYDEVVYCTVCGEELSREAKTIEKTAHTPGEAVRENEVAATCSAEGNYDEVVYCTECNAELGRTPKTIEKLQHKYTNYVFNNDATCTADGTETATCSFGCGTTDTRTKADSKLGHDWGEWTVTKAATCTEAGSKTRTCKNDSTHVETQAIAKLAHTDANGDTLCDVCGQPMANHQHTDVNGDGKCDTCGRDTDAHRHTDANGDNVCDNCGKTINTSFRCSMCDYNDQHRNTPVFGWFVIIIHFFVHLFAQMKAWV